MATGSFLNMWMEARAPIASTFGPHRGKNAETAARTHFAEHVITRPFAPPEKRKVTRPARRPGIPGAVEEYDFASAESLVGDVPLEQGAEEQFGLMHTDSNQHVNPLVYPRLFEEAVVRRLLLLFNLELVLEFGARPQEPRRASGRDPVAKAFFSGDQAQLAPRFGHSSR